MTYYQSVMFIFALSLAAFVFLRWKFPQADYKSLWKRMAVLNTIIGGAGILIAVMDNQRFLHEVEYNTVSGSHVGATIGLKGWATAMFWCDIPYDHELSEDEIAALRQEHFLPDNPNAVNRDHIVLCEWHNKIKDYISTLRFNEWPALDEAKFMPPKLETRNFDDWVEHMIYTARHYSANRVAILALKEQSEKSVMQIIVSFLAPFMLCVAVAFKVAEEAFK